MGTRAELDTTRRRAIQITDRLFHETRVSPSLVRAALREVRDHCDELLAALPEEETSGAD